MVTACRNVNSSPSPSGRRQGLDDFGALRSSSQRHAKLVAAALLALGDDVGSMTRLGSRHDHGPPPPQCEPRPHLRRMPRLRRCRRQPRYCRPLPRPVLRAVARAADDARSCAPTWRNRRKSTELSACLSTCLRGCKKENCASLTCGLVLGAGSRRGGLAASDPDPTPGA